MRNSKVTFNKSAPITKTISKRFTPLRIFECFSALVLLSFILTLCFWSENYTNITAMPKPPSESNPMLAKTISLTAAGTMGIFFILWRWKNRVMKAASANPNILSDSFSVAHQQLGSDKVRVRIDGIYKLWTTAKDAENDNEKIKILNIICDFIRSPSSKTQQSTELIIPNDVQIAVSLLTQHIDELKLVTKYKINLSGANLRGANLVNADMTGANLLGTNLCEANLQGAHLAGVFFSPTTFKGAMLTLNQCNDLQISNHQWIRNEDKNGS